MSIITVGTMAFDAIETPFGKVDKIIGAPQLMWLMPPVILCLMSNRSPLWDTIFPKKN